MQKLLKKIAELLRLARLDKRWKRAAGILAVIVVFCTTYMLILPAITMESEIICGLEEHVHSDSCYEIVETASGEESSENAEEKVLVCTLTEHTHSEKCYIEENQVELDSLDDEIQLEINSLNSMIASLPESDEVEAKIIEFEENNDTEGEEAYIREVSETAYICYRMYTNIQELYADCITDYEKVSDLSWLWSRQTFGLNSDGTVSVGVYAVNNVTSESISYHSPYIVYGTTARSLGITNFAYWMGIVVECDSSGNMYVAKIVYSGTAASAKYDLKASSANGFVLYIWDSKSDYYAVEQYVSIGDSVAVNFDYRTKTSEKSSAIGTVTFGGSVLEDKDNSDELHIVESADTYNLIQVNLFDYGSNINDMYSSNTAYPGFQQNGGTTGSFTSLNANKLNFGDTITADLSAGKTGITGSSATGINKMNSENLANRPTENAMSYLLGDDGCPVLANGLSLGYLFTDGTYAKKQNTDNINGLFIQDEDTGLYHYNSHDNHAQFDAKTNTFTLYEEVISPNYMMYPFGNFMPYIDIVHDSKKSSDIDGTYLSLIANRAYAKYSNGSGSEYLGLYNALNSFVSLMNTAYTSSWTAKDAVNYYFKQSGIKDSAGNYVTFTNDDLSSIYTLDYDIPTDFYFGMSMDMTFIQPKGGLTGTTGTEPLQFYFTGDDDVWIYIDGVLFLDLSGIHRHVGGEIDFVNGKVYYYELLSTTGDVSDTPYKTETFKEILERAGKSTDGLNASGTFSDYTTHTLKFFYMERGSGSGVCRMNFNLPLVKDNTITITKELSIDDGDVDIDDVLGNPYYSFQVFQVVNGEKTENLYVAPNTAYEVLDASGNKLRDAVTDSNGIIKIKKGETAVVIVEDDNVGEYFVREIIDEDFVAQYGQVIVDGESTTTSLSGIYLGSDSFSGYDSAIKDILRGDTAFTYNNRIDSSELGALSLTKELEGSENSNAFTFNVVIDDIPIPVGTPYILISADGTQTDMSVTEEGQVYLKAGETVLIKNILAGSYFTVTEEDGGQIDYTLSFKENGEYYTSDGESASGYMLPHSTVSPIVMTAVNIEDGTFVTVEGTKILENPDGSSHSYTVMLEEVTDSGGGTLTDGGTQLQTDVTLTENSSESFSFTIVYYDSQLNTGENKFYYRIYEYQTQSLADSTDFDDSVYVAEVTVNKTETEITALITALFKNGEEVSIDELEFINTLIGQFTVSKEVEGDMTDVHTTADFEFALEFSYSDAPLDGTYIIEKTDSSDAVTESEITLEDGKAVVYIKHNESFTVKGLPVGTVVKVTENTAGYYTTYTADGSDVRNDGNSTQLTVDTAAKSIKFFNHVAYILPSTGGNGTQAYIIGGLLIGLSAVFLLCCMKKRRERRLGSSRL